MTNNPDEIRADIERTRNELGRDVDALAEKTDPSKAIDRQADKLKSRWTDMRESVFGSDDDHYSDGRSGGRAGQLADDASEAAHNAPQTIKRKTRGNPLAAGAIALAAGWLLSSLLPSSKAEQDAAATVKDKAEPLVEEAKSVAQDMGDTLQPQAQEAASAVQDRAMEGVDRVKDEGAHRAEEIKEDSKRAAENVQDSARDS